MLSCSPSCCRGAGRSNGATSSVSSAAGPVLSTTPRQPYRAARPPIDRAFGHAPRPGTNRRFGGTPSTCITKNLGMSLPAGVREWRPANPNRVSVSQPEYRFTGSVAGGKRTKLGFLGRRSPPDACLGGSNRPTHHRSRGTTRGHTRRQAHRSHPWNGSAGRLPRRTSRRWASCGLWCCGRIWSGSGGTTGSGCGSDCGMGSRRRTPG